MTASDLQKIAQKLINFLDEKAAVEVVEKDGYRIKITPIEPGRLIGKFGETLDVLQYILRMMVAHLAGEFIPLTVDVGGYKESREKEIEELATLMAENVKKSDYPQELRPMNAYERRLVHVALKDFKGVKVFSIGEGELRRVRIEKE